MVGPSFLGARAFAWALPLTMGPVAMKITVTGTNFDVGEALTRHVEDELTELTDKYQLNTHEIDVRLTKEPHRFFSADITIHLGHGVVLNAKAEASEPYPAFDMAAEKVGKRMRRYKRKLRDHHRAAEAPKGFLAQAYVIDTRLDEEPPEDDAAEHGENGDQPLIIAEMETKIEWLSVSEAVMRLELADLPVLTFHNTTHGGINVIYRREDGNIAWIDPQVIEGTTAAA